MTGETTRENLRETSGKQIQPRFRATYPDEHLLKACERRQEKQSVCNAISAAEFPDLAHPRASPSSSIHHASRQKKRGLVLSEPIRRKLIDQFEQVDERLGCTMHLQRSAKR
jgi:hypothetical protein